MNLCYVTNDKLTEARQLLDKAGVGGVLYRNPKYFSSDTDAERGTRHEPITRVFLMMGSPRAAAVVEGYARLGIKVEVLSDSPPAPSMVEPEPPLVIAGESTPAIPEAPKPVKRAKKTVARKKRGSKKSGR